MPEEQRLIEGLSVEQYAGVSAALAEGVPLAEVLAQEQIEPGKWALAEQGWRAAVAGSAEVHIDYMQKRRQAEDCLTRKVDPLNDDAAAWVGLLGALATADQASDVLGPLGLKMSDVGRLGRHWKRKTEKDPKIGDQLTELAGKAKPPAKVSCGPVELRPFPWTPPPPLVDEVTAGFAEARAGVMPLETDIELYAAFTAVTEIAPDEKTAAARLCGLSEAKFKEVDVNWRVRLRGDPDLRAEFLVKAADFRTAFRRMLAGARPVIVKR